LIAATSNLGIVGADCPHIIAAAKIEAPAIAATGRGINDEY
jgi:hypothetical protein